MRTLAVRLDSMGDVLVTGPAIRALAATSSHLTLLCGPLGREAAQLLPGVDDVLCWAAPWVLAEPPPASRDTVTELVDLVAARGFDRAVVFTSFHQSALPTALLLRLAGIGWIGAVSSDYPGSLLDLRHPDPGDVPEPERALDLAYACGGRLPDGDDGTPTVRASEVPRIPIPGPYVVLHPGTSAPARAWPPDRFAEVARRLPYLGLGVVVTGGADETDLTAYVCSGSPTARDLGGALDLPRLASVLADAEVVVAGNTGPAHLAAAVGTPVVSLFAPTVPARRWAPYGVRCVVLGDQHAPCRGTHARECPVPGHPCLTSIDVDDVVDAVETLLPLTERNTP